MPILGEFRSIYVRAPNWVGDFVAATALFRELRAAYPKARILLGARPHLEPLARNAPWYDEFLAVETRTGKPGIRETAKRLREAGCDLAILLPNSFRSALPPFLAGVPHRLGYSGGGRTLLLTRRLSPPREGMRRIHVPMPYSYGMLLSLIGVTPKSLRPELFFDEATGREAEQYLAKRGIARGERYAVVSPGASFGSSKLWNVESFAAVIDGLRDRFSLKTFVHCGPGEEKICQEIEARCKNKPASSYDEKRGLQELKPIVARCSLLVTTDSGPRHFGVAFDRPIVCLMGPTSPFCTHANVEKTEIVRIEVDCGPCHLKTCPLDHRCMQQITPGMVLAAAEKLPLG